MNLHAPVNPKAFSRSFRKHQHGYRMSVWGLGQGWGMLYKPSRALAGIRIGSVIASVVSWRPRGLSCYAFQRLDPHNLKLKTVHREIQLTPRQKP